MNKIKNKSKASVNVPSAEGLLVELEGCAGRPGWVTQSVQSSGDAFGSTAENSDTLTEKHAWISVQGKGFAVRLSRASAWRSLTVCCYCRSPPAGPSTWADPAAAWWPAAGTSPHANSGPEGTEGTTTEKSLLALTKHSRHFYYWKCIAFSAWVGRVIASIGLFFF